MTSSTCDPMELFYISAITTGHSSGLSALITAAICIPFRDHNASLSSCCWLCGFSSLAYRSENSPVLFNSSPRSEGAIFLLVPHRAPITAFDKDLWAFPFLVLGTSKLSLLAMHFSLLKLCLVGPQTKSYLI